MMTGWEHDVPEGDTLLRRWVLTNLTRFRTLVERIDGRIDVWDAAALFDTGSPVVYDNAVVLRRPVTPDELEEAIDTAHVFFPAGRPWLLMSVWPLPDLTGSGLTLVGHPPFMARLPAVGTSPTTGPPGFDIEEVTAGSIGTFAETLGAGFGLPGAAASPWADPRVLGDDLRLFVGHLDGEAGATAAAFIAHGVVDIEMVSCLERCRGQGIGEAITWAATRVDANLPAVLMSSDPGRPVYERMGYISVLRMTLWSTPGS
jgi:hypothetical protein